MAIKTYGTLTGTNKTYGTATGLLGNPGTVDHVQSALNTSVSPTTAGTLGAVTKPQAATATSITPTTAAAGFVTDFGVATNVTVSPTTTSSGTVTDFGTASLTVSPTPSATGTETLFATGAIVVSPTPAATTGAVTKTQTAVGVSLIPTQVSLPANGTQVTYRIAIPGGNSAAWVVNAEFLTNTVSNEPTIQPNGGRLASANYYAADGVTPVLNTAGWTGNGNAVAVPLNTWSDTAWGYVSGPGIYFIDFTFTNEATYAGTNAAQFLRNVRATIDGEIIVPALSSGTLGGGAALQNGMGFTATPTAMTKTTSAVAVTASPSPLSAGEAWLVLFYQPDAILSMTGLTGTVSEIQDSPSSPDGNSLDPTGGAVDLRFSFENHNQILRTNANDQTIRVRVTAV